MSDNKSRNYWAIVVIIFGCIGGILYVYETKAMMDFPSSVVIPCGEGYIFEGADDRNNRGVWVFYEGEDEQWFDDDEEEDIHIMAKIVILLPESYFGQGAVLRVILDVGEMFLVSGSYWYEVQAFNQTHLTLARVS